MIVGEELTLFGVAIRCSNGAVVGYISVASVCGVMYASTWTDDFGHDGAIFKGYSDGKSCGFPQLFFVYFVAGIAVAISSSL